MNNVIIIYICIYIHLYKLSIIFYKLFILTNYLLYLKSFLKKTEQHLLYINIFIYK